MYLTGSPLGHNSNPQLGEKGAEMIRRILPVIFLITGLSLLTACSEKTENNSPKLIADTLLITNAVLYDGSGGAAYKGSLRIQNGIIAAVGIGRPAVTDPTRDRQQEINANPIGDLSHFNVIFPEHRGTLKCI